MILYDRAQRWELCRMLSVWWTQRWGWHMRRGLLPACACGNGRRDMTDMASWRAGLIVHSIAPTCAVRLMKYGYARLPRVTAYNSEVSWVLPTRVIRP